MDYINNIDLEKHWKEFNETGKTDEFFQDIMLMIEKISWRFGKHLRDRDEVISQTLELVLAKADSGKLIHDGRGPAFRLMTTIIYRTMINVVKSMTPRAYYKWDYINNTNSMEEEDWLEELRDGDDYLYNCLIELMTIESHKTHTTEYWADQLFHNYGILAGEKLIDLTIKKICLKMLELGCKDKLLMRFVVRDLN